MPYANKCPKCSYFSDEAFEECPKCLVVIDKFIKRSQTTTNIGHIETESYPVSETSAKFIRKTNKALFVVLLLIFGLTFFLKDNYRDVIEIDPEVLAQPIQDEITNSHKIQFTKEYYQYELTPLYQYQISGLVVSRMAYDWGSMDPATSVFPMDLCLIWGSNVANKTYQSKLLDFSQDSRFCRCHVYGDVDFSWSELSNNHLIVNNEKMRKKLHGIARGDQVQIKGKLVNVYVKVDQNKHRSGSSYNSFATSVIRTDSGAGACEIIYVDDVKILRKSKMAARLLYSISGYGLILLVIWIVGFEVSIPFYHHKRKSFLSDKSFQNQQAPADIGHTETEGEKSKSFISIIFSKGWLWPLLPAIFISLWIFLTSDIIQSDSLAKGKAENGLFVLVMFIGMYWLTYIPGFNRILLLLPMGIQYSTFRQPSDQEMNFCKGFCRVVFLIIIYMIVWVLIKRYG
ncbi:MAG: hypothetical protein V1753_01870 [Pseudomonadota bacterium]